MTPDATPSTTPSAMSAEPRVLVEGWSGDLHADIRWLIGECRRKADENEAKDKSTVAGQHAFSVAISQRSVAAAMEEALKAAQSSGWRRTADELPPVGERVLVLFDPAVFVHNTSMSVLKFHNTGANGWSSLGLGYSFEEVSHWCPLLTFYRITTPDDGPPVCETTEATIFTGSCGEFHTLAGQPPRSLPELAAHGYAPTEAGAWTLAILLTAQAAEDARQALQRLASRHVEVLFAAPPEIRVAMGMDAAPNERPGERERGDAMEGED